MDSDILAYYERELARLNARADYLEAQLAELERLHNAAAAIEEFAQVNGPAAKLRLMRSSRTLPD